MGLEHGIGIRDRDEGICKRFGGIRALREVDLELRRGEIMASSATMAPASPP